MGRFLNMLLATLATLTTCVAFTTTTHKFGGGLGGVGGSILPLKLDYAFLINTTDVTDLTWPLYDKTLISNKYTLAPPDSAPTMTGSTLGIGWSVDLLASGPSTETSGHVCYVKNMTEFKKSPNTYLKWITVAMQESGIQVSHATGVALDIKSFCLGAHKNATLGPGTFCSPGIFEITLTLDCASQQPATAIRNENLALPNEHVRGGACPGVGQ
jgi:hypothetical protein